MELIKAVPLGAFLTWIVALFIGSAGSRGGQLAVHLVEFDQVSFHWSWPLFIAGTGLAWGIMLLQR